MTAPFFEEAQAIASRIANAPALLAAFDYDGTLAPIRLRPEEAIAPPEILRALEELAHAPGTTVAVVTGRALEDLYALVPLRGVHAIGRHGLEHASPEDAPKIAPGFDRDALARGLDEVRPAAAAIAAQHEGLRLEDKLTGLVLHVRGAPEDLGERAIEVFRELVPEGYEGILGKKVFEIRPAGPDKGRGLIALRDHASPGALVLYAGDDATDEDAFRILSAEDAITVHVGNGPTEARWRVPDPAGVLELIRVVARARA